MMRYVFDNIKDAKGNPIEATVTFDQLVEMQRIGRRAKRLGESFRDSLKERAEGMGV